MCDRILIHPDRMTLFHSTPVRKYDVVCVGNFSSDYNYSTEESHHRVHVPWISTRCAHCYIVMPLEQYVQNGKPVMMDSRLCTYLHRCDSPHRTLINIWVPSAFLRGETSNNQHHVYQVYVRIRDDEWNVYRRYSQFLDLHTRIKKVYPVVGNFEFPAKKSIGNKVL